MLEDKIREAPFFKASIWWNNSVSWAKWQKTVGNWIKKDLWNWLIKLMPATVWHILNVKTIHLPDTEMVKVSLKKSWNHIKQTELNLCLAGFNHLKPLHGFQFLNCDGVGGCLSSVNLKHKNIFFKLFFCKIRLYLWIWKILRRC